jgi:HD-GYP domain-containing protein (c-di-GMP phosphodiesterase class II)
MRYISASCLREGMLLGKSIYSDNEMLFLSKGQKLSSKNIFTINNLGYQGVYISDNISDDIEVINIISDELRQKTISAVKNVFIATKTNNKNDIEKTFENSKKLVEDMVNDIISNKVLMVNMVDLKIFNDYTFSHSVNVAVLAIVMGLSMKYSYNSLYNLGLGALLHDVGKVFISKDILDKPGALTNEEFTRIKQHAQLGYDYLIKNCVLPSEAYTVVLQHHERYNASGYPNKLIGSKTSMDSKIIAIVDVYDAMVSDRPYRKGIPPSEVMEYIVCQSSELFDPEVVKVFYKKIALYPVSTVVQLSNGEKGLVLENFESYANRPRIRIVYAENSYKEVNLKENKEYLNVIITGITTLE